MHPQEPLTRSPAAQVDGVDADTLRTCAARHGDLADFDDNLAWLVESRLLLPWAWDASDYPRFATIRVLPCGIGAGNVPGDPGRFAILARRDAAPAVWVDLVGYTLWSFCDGQTTLQAACQATADHLQIPLDTVRARALPWLPR